MVDEKIIMRKFPYLYYYTLENRQSKVSVIVICNRFLCLLPLYCLCFIGIASRDYRWSLRVPSVYPLCTSEAHLRVIQEERERYFTYLQ